MNRSKSLTGDMKMTVLDRQRARMKWQENQQDEGCFGNLFTRPNDQQLLFQSNNNNGHDGDSLFDQVVNRVLKSDPDFENGWQDLKTGFGDGTGFMMNYHGATNTSCTTLVAGVDNGGEAFKKRKVNKVVAEDETRDKKMKNCAEEGDSKITDQTSSKKNNNNNNRDTSGDNTSKENSKVSEVDKRDYIHVRARRGQATDSHSLAERVRREKISERMKYLQDLVPGCNKITGKAGMLDEIINYVQSLQRQVEFLSMKLAVVNPRFDVSMDSLITKEVFPACTTSYPSIGVSSEMGTSTNMHFNQLQQLMSCGEMEMGINNPDLGLLRRTTSASLSSPETFLDSSCFTQILNNSGWDADLQNIYSLEYQQAGRSGLFPSQQFTGSVEASNLKMEM